MVISLSAFLYGVTLQWKLDLRNRGILLTYYIVPLIFFGFMGGIFTSIDPAAYKTLIPSMTVFGISMGAIAGSPSPLVEFFSGDIKKAYAVGRVPIWTAVINNFISAFIHLFIMSLIIFFVAPIAFNATMPINLPLYFSMLALFLATCLCIGTVLGVLVKGMNRLTMVSQLIFLPSIILSGIMFPSKMLPEFLQVVAKILPATWGYDNMCGQELDIFGILPLFAIIVICIIITVWRIRNTIK